MNRAPVACAAVGIFVVTLVLTACGGGADSSKPSAASSCASQVAAWEGSGVRADLGNLPSQLTKTSSDVQQEGAGSLTGSADTSAAKSDLGTLQKEYKLLTAHQPPSCVRNLRSDYATFLRFDNYVVNQELPAFIKNPGDVVDGNLAWGHATYAAGLLPQVQKDLKGYSS